MQIAQSLTAIVGANVRAEMARRRISQQQLANHLGVSQGAISKRLAGTVPFDVNEVGAIAELLGVHISDLLPEVSAA
jgi:transcriptional regulator with XRE-family HTH domain